MSQARGRELPPITLDVEASGFGRGSYPIEIGLCFPDGSSVAYLIRPVEEWTHWDESAEAVHGIARSQLVTRGRSVVEVAALLNGHLAGNRAYSDAWSFDASWVARLFDAAGFSQHFRIDTIRSLFDESMLEVWQTARDEVLQENGPLAHRAAVDACLLQRSLVRARELARR